MQTLDDAYSRVKRAGVHLTNLNRRVNNLSKVIQDSIVVNRQPHIFTKEGQEILGFKDDIKFTTQQVPHTIKILIGEIAYNLRAALDYLVYELAHLDSGKIIDNTQFLIEESPEDFKKIVVIVSKVSMANMSKLSKGYKLIMVAIGLVYLNIYQIPINTEN